MLPEQERATATGDRDKKFVISPAVPEICSWTDRKQTHRQIDYNTPLPYRAGVIINRLFWRQIFPR